jgi:hypothetical protein
MSALLQSFFWPMLGLFAVLCAVAYRIATGCRHQWETMRVAKVMADGYKIPFAFDYELRCTKCGSVKKKRV